MGRNKPFRIIALGDMHSGAAYGLTHHSLLAKPPPDAPPDALAMYEGRKEMQEAYYDILRENKPFDTALLLGDLTEGPGERSHGVGVLQGDPAWQVDNAVALVKKIRAKHHVFVQGTPYHSLRWGSVEKQIAERFDCPIYNHPFVQVHGKWFDIKHKTARSSIPHGKMTPVAKTRMWNALLSAKGRQPKADVILRAHVHEHHFCGDVDWLALTVPGLQGPSDYGEREVEGSVDFGVAIFDISPKGDLSWRVEVRALDVLKSKQVHLSE